nr:MAG TPA: hypothetical protein [Caudoviricetes sp.]
MIIGRAIIVTAPPSVKADKILNNNTWEVIKEVSDKSQGQNYWAVGDCKEITMNGKVSDGLTLSNYSTWVFIIGFDHNAEREGTGIAFQGFKTTQTGGTDICLVDSGYNSIPRHTGEPWFYMNELGTNTGGWEASEMRTKIMPLIKAAFPADLQSVIKTSTIYTDNTGGGVSNPAPTATQDEVFLLAEYEIFGTRSYATTQEANYLKQYAYYTAGNSEVKYKHNATSSDAYWWERSLYSGDSYRFCVVTPNGDNYFSATYGSNGVAPAFKV